MEYLKQSIDTIEADGGNYAIDGSIKVVWDSTSNMDEMNLTGFYYITGTRTNTNDNFPVNNTGNIVAWLRVANVDATNSFISQILDFGNVGGKDATTYVRTYNGSKWSSWQKMQTMNEVGVVASLDSFIDNGMYSGVLQSNYEMFVLITINNYAVSSTAGTTRTIAQFKYSLAIDGNVTYSTRTGYGADTILWSEWSDIAQKKVSEEAALRTQADKNLQTQIDSINEFLNSDFLEQNYAYGVEWDTTISSPNCTRIGNMNLHRSLPVQSAMRGCLLNDNGVVVEYLPANDWTTAVRDGSRGQVMVELPKHYRKFVTDGTKRQVWLSMMPLAGYHEVPKAYVSAYEASIDRTNLKLASVVNTTEQYRGGDNTAEWDGTYRSLLGLPVSRLNFYNYRDYARKRNPNTKEWNMYEYNIHKAIVWFFVVEYATFDSQTAFTSALTSEGFKQGGLGMGVSLINNTKLSPYNSGNPFIPCGYTDSLGNNTGVVLFTLPSEYDATPTTTEVIRYRGIENVYGHLMEKIDGVLVDSNSDIQKAYVCDNPVLYDVVTDNYRYAGEMPRPSEAYIKDIIFGEHGDILPSAVGGSANSHYNMCDVFVSDNYSRIRCMSVVGSMCDSYRIGLFYTYVKYDFGLVGNSQGTRLCFIPNT